MGKIEKNDEKIQIKEKRYKIDFTKEDSMNKQDEIVNINGTEISVVPYIKQATATLIVMFAINTILETIDKSIEDGEEISIFETFADFNDSISVFNLYVLTICTDIKVDESFDFDLFEETVFWNEIKNKITNYKEVLDLFVMQINNLSLVNEIINGFEDMMFSNTKSMDKLLTELSDIDKEKLKLVLQSEVAKEVKESTKKERTREKNENKKVSSTKKDTSKMN